MAFHDRLALLGLGEDGDRFPGEEDERLPSYAAWRTWMNGVILGYNLNITTIQLAQAYSVFANEGFFSH